MARTRVLGLCLIAVIYAASMAHSLAADSSNRPEKETRLKALILYKTPKLISWETPAQRDSKNFRYCIQGDRNFEKVLGGIVAGKLSGGKTIEVKPFDINDGHQICHIIYFGQTSSLNKEANSFLLQKLADTGALIVGSHDGFIGKGGHVNLTSFRNRIGFEISEDLISGDRFKLNSRLAGFATIIPRTSGTR